MLATITVVLSVPVLAAKPVEFAREIRPILSDTCFKCHGVDAAKRKGGLRLDQKKEWFHPREEGTLVVPGKPQESLVFTRITHSDPDDQMPPREEVRQLTPLEISKIRDWILQGANWQPHWSFVPLRRPALPKNDNASWTLGPIDRYIGQRMVEAGLHPAETTDKPTLLRRVTLDLTGLPPTLKELDTFLQDTSDHAYERAVDRLLSSPRYGEHLAVDWLDLARYADTDGYQDDEPRTMWRWREWLINVLNDNMPFDQFTIEQLAGDLLPDATPEQRLATGFLRNNRVNGEGGSIAEEFRVEYIVDRVETASSVWMGLTTGCAAVMTINMIRSRKVTSTPSLPSSTRPRNPEPIAVMPSRLYRSPLVQTRDASRKLPGTSNSLTTAPGKRWKRNARDCSIAPRKP